MRVNYVLEVEDIGVPRFSVEAVEGIGKLFTLATLVLNVLDEKPVVEIVFHGLNPEDPERRLLAFQKIIESSSDERELVFDPGSGGQVPGSSSSFQWVRVHFA